MLFLLFDIFALAFDSVNDFKTPLLSEIAEGLLCTMVTVIWIMYIALFAKFLLLFRKNKGTYDTIKWQVVSFFTTVIALLTFRLALHWIFFADDYTTLVVILYHDGNSKKLFWVHLGQLIVVVVESIFNIVVLYNLINTVKNQERVTMREIEREDSLRKSLRMSQLRVSLKGSFSPTSPKNASLLGSSVMTSKVPMNDIDDAFAEVFEQEMTDELDEI